MKILFIGGTGTISMAISRRLLEQGHELYLINRGNRNAGLAAAAARHGRVEPAEGNSGGYQ